MDIKILQKQAARLAAEANPDELEFILERLSEFEDDNLKLPERNTEEWKQGARVSKGEYSLSGNILDSLMFDLRYHKRINKLDFDVEEAAFVAYYILHGVVKP